jgi:hypothetical protein
MRICLTVFLLFPVVCLFSSCSAPEPATPAAPASDYNVDGTIKDIMDSLVDPAADYIFESLGTEASAEGVVEKRPRTDDEWKEERRRAIVLVESANLLMMPGRKVAKAGEKAQNPEVELNPDQIEALINKNPAAYYKLVKEFQQTAIEQLKAVDNRDIQELMRTTGDMDARCENCHKVYWYPNDPAYKGTSEGKK